MILIVDTNEEATNPEMMATLRRNFSHVIKAKLKAGDINIPLKDGTLLAIERKTPHDFLSSIADGRLFEQVERMATEAKYSAFIVTGRFKYKDKSDMVVIIDENGNEDDRNNWKGASVRAAITVLQYSGCPVIFCPPSKFCQTIVELYNLVNKPDERQSVKKHRLISFPPVDERVQFIAQLPGVGFKPADNLMRFAGVMNNVSDKEWYGSIADALHWVSIMVQIDKAERPDGWGPAKILNVRKFLGLDSDEYIAAVREIEVIDKQGKKSHAIEIDGTIYVKAKKVKNE